jgi:serine/threonine-protein kinase
MDGWKAMRISLAVEEGPHKGQRFEFDQHDNFIVGRSDRARFRLPVKDKCISRIHFMIEMNPPQCRLIDMGSTNGTRVNGQKVTTVDLKDGDRITAGATVLVVTVSGGEDRPDSSPETFVSQSDSNYVLSLGSQDARSVSPPGSPGPTVDHPAQARTGPRPSGPVPGGCRVCAAPVMGIGSATSGEHTMADADAIPLCPSCRELIRAHPQSIPGYQIVRELGRGGMGVVYLAIRVVDGGVVALKTIKPAIAASKVETERFLREAQILSELDHPNIVSFHEMGETDGVFHFAMNYVKGIDAARLQKQQRGPLPIARAVGLVCQLLQALDYAHAKGFVHRDIKPANMLVTQEGGRDVVKLSDFGLGRIYQTTKMSGLTMNGDLGGTAPFMAPEQVTELRNARPPVDQYSAGATLYKLLTDRYIYDLPNTVHQQVMKILLEDPMPIRERRPDLPEGLAEIIHRSLAREPQARFANVKEMRRALTPFAR